MDMETAIGWLLRLWAVESFLERIRVDQPESLSHFWKWIWSLDLCLSSRKLVTILFSFYSYFLVK